MNTQRGFSRHFGVPIAILWLACCVGMGPARAADITSARSGSWDDTNTWSSFTVPTGSDNVTIGTGHTVTNFSTNVQTIASLTILTNGVLTHAANVGTEAYKVVLNIAGALTIDLGGSINVDGRGFQRQNGPYLPSHWAMGGSHGGRGGSDPVYAMKSDAPTYDSFRAPERLGAAANWSNNGDGGGAVRLSVNGKAVMNGVISANGGIRPGQTTGTAGGAGGSVYLTAASLSGSGTIQANGGSSGADGTGGRGGGGGGRVAVILTASNDFDRVTIRAWGGYATAYPGGAGTVYLQTQEQGEGNGDLIVDTSILRVRA